MKKLLTSLALIAIGVQAAFSQGQVNFNNTVTTFGSDGVDRFVYLDTVGGTRLSGTNYVAALYWAKGSDPLINIAQRALDNPNLVDAIGTFRISTSTAIGTWAGGGARYFVGAQIGETVNLQVRVWDITRFATYAQAAAAGGVAGQSQPFSFLIPASTDTAGLAMKNLRAFALVPEPSTIALGVLGLGSLLLFRRKKI